LGFIGIVISIFEPSQGKTLGSIARFWAKIILFFSGIPYTINGLENLDTKKNYIFAGNHASGFDILLAFAGLPYWLVSIAKIELRSIPILGWVMRAARHIFVDRSNHDNAIKSLEKAKESLYALPRSVLLFPEGTRTKDGSLGVFKRGGLLLGIQAGIPIVPIAFVGTFDVLEKGSWSLKKLPIELRIGKPITTESFSYETRRDMAERIKESVKVLLEEG